MEKAKPGYSEREQRTIQQSSARCAFRSMLTMPPPPSSGTSFSIELLPLYLHAIYNDTRSTYLIVNIFSLKIRFCCSERILQVTDV